MNLNSSSFFSFHLLDKAKRSATTKWRRFESWSNQRKWSLLHEVFSIGTFHSGFHGGVNGRPVVRALTGTPKIACIDIKIRRIVRLPFSLTCCPLLRCKREVAAKRTNQGGAASPNSRNSAQITGCRHKLYVIVRMFNIKGVYGIYRKGLYYLKILPRIFTFIIGSNPPAKYS